MSAPGLFGRSIHGARWIGISKALSQAFMWVVTIYVVQLLDPSDYGLMAMGGMLTILAGMLLDAGLGVAFVQRRDVSVAVYRSANGALLLGALLAVGLVQLLAAPFARFFDAPPLELVLRVASLQLVIGMLAVVPGSKLQGEMRFKEMAISQALGGVGSSVVTLVLALTGAGVWSLVFGVMALRVILLVMYLAYAGGFDGLSFRFGLLRSYLGFSANLIAQRLAWFWVEQVDQLIIGRMLGTAPLGAYSVARNLSHVPLDRTAEIVNQVSLPSFAAVQDDTQRWRDGLRKLIRLASATSFPVFWGMAAVAPTALPLLLGPKWDAAVLPFILFCAVLPLRTAHSLTCTVLLGLGRADLSFRTVLVWAVVLTPLFVLGARYGLTGVTLAWVLGFPLVYLASVWMIVRTLNIPASLMFEPMLAPALSAGGCAGVVFALQAGLHGYLPPAPLLGLEIVCGALTYVLALRLLSRQIFAEVLDLVLRFAGKRAPTTG
jgi:O-antigen/teichoic acid export membrane protein